MALFPGLPRSAGTRKVKPIWILLKQETVSDSGISWAICTSAPCSKQITMPAPHHSVFLQAGCPSCRPTNSVKALKATNLIIKNVCEAQTVVESVHSASTRRRSRVEQKSDCGIHEVGLWCTARTVSPSGRWTSNVHDCTPKTAVKSGVVRLFDLLIYLIRKT